MTKLSNGLWEQQNLRLTLVCSWSLFPLGRDISTWWCAQPPRTWRSGSAGSRCPRWCAGLSSAPLAARCKRPPQGTRNSGSTAHPQTRCPRSPPARPHWTQSETFLQGTNAWRFPGLCSFNHHRTVLPAGRAVTTTPLTAQQLSSKASARTGLTQVQLPFKSAAIRLGITVQICCLSCHVSLILGDHTFKSSTLLDPVYLKLSNRL